MKLLLTQSVPLSLLFLACTPWQIAAQPQRIAEVQDVLRTWSPDQHLYVKGDLGVGDAQYRSLEDWLDQHGPHWTIVLMANAERERYETADGRWYRGMDAVEHALGLGLTNQTGFGQLEHPTTGETDGTVFVLFLRERKFSYFSSDAQDRRGLGQSHWIGKLDRAAFRAMRQGGRILDAVKGTVRQINESLERALASEVAEQARLDRERARAVQAVRDDVAEALRSVQIVEERAKQVATRGRSGTMATPPVGRWRQALGRSSEDLNPQNVRSLSQQVAQISAEVQQYLNWFADYDAFDNSAGKIQAGVDELRASDESVVRPMIQEALDRLKRAGTEREAADPVFVDRLQEAAAAVARGEQLLTAERQRRARAQLHRRIVRRTVAGVLIALALAFGLLLYFLNRRRIPTMQEALTALTERESTVRREMDQVLTLFDRGREILGTRETLTARGYEGTTQQWTGGALDKIDDLLIMSNEVDRVMDEARELIQPSDWVGKLNNLFRATQYERGIHRLSGEPIRFHENQGIPSILRPEDAADLEEISLTFEQVFTAFREKGTETLQRLDSIEQCLLDVNDQLQQLQAKIDRATELEQTLQEMAEEDGFFDLTNFFDRLLPSAIEDHAVADEIAAVDPVRAVRDIIPSGVRKLYEAEVISATAQNARTAVFPIFDEHAPRLRDMGYETEWIEQETHALSINANELMAAAAESSVQMRAGELAADVEALGQRVVACAELGHRLDQEWRPSVDELRQRIGAARDEIAQQLHLGGAQCLQESESNPDDRRTAAIAQLDAMRAALNHGKDDAANQAATLLEQEVAAANEIIERTRNVLLSFESERDALRKRHQALRAELPALSEQVDRLQGQYSDAAQFLSAADSAYPDPDATVGSLEREVQGHLEEGLRELEEAGAGFRQGQLLDAAANAKSAQHNFDQARRGIHEIRQHEQRLADASRKNAATLRNQQDRLQSLTSQLDDPRTTEPTVAAHQDLTRELRDAERAIDDTNTARHPFANASRLQETQAQIDQLAARLMADRDAHGEATRAIRGAEAQLAAALRLVDQSRRDDIPDSPLTVRCVNQIRQLESELERNARRLDEPRQDWQQIDDAGARLQARLSERSAELSGELQLARQSVDLLERASRDVFSASRWTGRYGVRVDGSPGAQDLDRARRALTGGDYSLMVELSRTAMVAASEAIQRAEREIERRRRAEKRRIESRRRAARARRQSSQRVSRPRLTGRSSSSSRGRSSSNSGFSRSGW